jgi:hypothetical protein
MGVPLPEGFKTKVTADNRFLAGTLAELCPVPYDWSLPLCGRPFEETLDWRPASWQDLDDSLDIASFDFSKAKSPSRSRILQPAYPFERDCVRRRTVVVKDEILFEETCSDLFGCLFAVTRTSEIRLPRHDLELEPGFVGFYETRESVVRNHCPDPLDENWFAPVSCGFEEWCVETDFDVYLDAEGPCACTGSLFGVSQYCIKCF